MRMKNTNMPLETHCHLAQLNSYVDAKHNFLRNTVQVIVQIFKEVREELFHAVSLGVLMAFHELE